MLNALKGMIGQGAAKFGYTIVPNWTLDTYSAARYMRSLFALLKVDLVLDVGANEGQYYNFLREQVGYAGQVISFEPIPELVAILKLKAVKSKRWHVDGRALGSKVGILQFNIMQNKVMSSFLTPDHSEVGDLLRGSNEINHTVDVDVVTIDFLLPKLISQYKSKCTFLKIDTQGFDLEVLGGAINSLPGIAALQTEASVVPLYQGMPTYHDVIQFLEKNNFVLSGIYPVNSVFFPKLVEFDCYMINGKRLTQQKEEASK